MPRVKDYVLSERLIDKVPIAELRKEYRKLMARYKIYKTELGNKKKSVSKFKTKSAVRHLIYRQGKADGKQAVKEHVRQTRRGEINRSNVVDSIARTAILINKLTIATHISSQHVAILLWAGEYDTFFFAELKAAMELIGETLVYSKVAFLRRKNYIHTVARMDNTGIWALTPLGKELYLRMMAYIKKHIQEVKPV